MFAGAGNSFTKLCLLALLVFSSSSPAVKAATTWSRWAKFRTSNPNDYTEIAIFDDHALVTSVVPADTEWFGYHFFPGEIDSEILKEILAGKSLETDPDIDLGYMFRLNHEAKTASGFSQYSSYLGAIPDYIQNAPPVFECQRQYAAAGDVCQFNETKGTGDFMAKIQSIMLLGLRGQALEKQDLEIVNTVWTNDTARVTWKRSLVAPFDGPSLRIRYASAALVVEEDTLLLPYDPIDGFKYHGHGTGISQVITFREADNIPPSVSPEGRLHSEWMTPEILLVGGSTVGWNVLGGSNVFTGYENVTVPLGTTLRFVYFILIPVVTVSTVLDDEAAFDACDFSNAKKLGGLYDSPVDVVLDQPGIRYFASDFINPSSGKSSCESGAKIKVMVMDNPNKPTTGPATTGTSEGESNSSPGTIETFGGGSGGHVRLTFSISALLGIWVMAIVVCF